MMDKRLAMESFTLGNLLFIFKMVITQFLVPLYTTQNIQIKDLKYGANLEPAGLEAEVQSSAKAKLIRRQSG